jgi:hypothetical protein
MVPELSAGTGFEKQEDAASYFHGRWEIVMKALVYKGPRQVSIENVVDPRLEQPTEAANA